ncbi:MAG: PIG-L family deacetylase, partial [Gemmatimonadota bacterium]|nr:PIG-L family deacetylase [Gemmatimonadota bacterium]
MRQGLQRRFLRYGLLASFLLPALPPAAVAQEPGYEGAAGLGLAVRRLGVTKRVLMIGAHPDDEYTPLLARLALQEGAVVAYLSLTRGEGGQNGIGPELGESLGLLRTEELLAARTMDGAGQFFSRAYDFGFSKSAEETFRHWPREEILRDVVAVIRRFRPDVVITVFSGTPRDGHGQHQLSALIAQEAFSAAADPLRFPDQLRAGLRPHRTEALYQSLWGGPEGATLRIPVGELDPLLGRSPYQIAMASRSRHRSQDMGRAENAGPVWAHLRRVLPGAGSPTDGPVGEGPARAGIWSGVDTALALPEYAALVREIRAEVSLLGSDAVVPPLLEALRMLREAETGNTDAETRFRLASERRDVEDALRRAAGVVFEAVLDERLLAPGGEAQLTLSLWNGGARTLRIGALEPTLPRGWRAETLDSLTREIPPGSRLSRRFRIHVASDAAPSIPYFLQQPREGDLYRWPGNNGTDALPFQTAPVVARVEVEMEGADITLSSEAYFREVDLRQGELRRPVRVVPLLSVLLDPAVRILPIGAPRPLSYTVRLASQSPAGMAGTLRVQLPEGWRAEPASLPLRFTKPGEIREVSISVHPPAGVPAGEHPVSVVFEADDGTRFADGVQAVDYPHIDTRFLPRPARSTVRAVELDVAAGLRVGYISGAGEEGASILEQLGIRPVLLDAEALAVGELDSLEVIVAGSRAYEVRADLAAHNRRLLEWVRRGG